MRRIKEIKELLSKLRVFKEKEFADLLHQCHNVIRNTKAYPHGIRYLKKLDKLAASIADWKEFNHHEVFKAQIIEAHGRKRSFWSKYEVKK